MYNEESDVQIQLSENSAVEVFWKTVLTTGTSEWKYLKVMKMIHKVIRSSSIPTKHSNSPASLSVTGCDRLSSEVKQCTFLKLYTLNLWSGDFTWDTCASSVNIDPDKAADEVYWAYWQHSHGLAHQMWKPCFPAIFPFIHSWIILTFILLQYAISYWYLLCRAPIKKHKRCLSPFCSAATRSWCMVGFRAAQLHKILSVGRLAGDSPNDLNNYVIN